MILWHVLKVTYFSEISFKIKQILILNFFSRKILEENRIKINKRHKLEQMKVTSNNYQSLGVIMYILELNFSKLLIYIFVGILNKIGICQYVKIEKNE